MLKPTKNFVHLRHGRRAVFAKCSAKAQLRVLQHIIGYNVRSSYAVACRVIIPEYAVPGKDCCYEALVHPVTVPRCVCNMGRCAGRQPISEAGGEVGRVDLPVRAPEAPYVIPKHKRKVGQPVGDHVNVVVNLRGKVVAVLSGPLTYCLDLEWNASVIVWAV